MRQRASFSLVSEVFRILSVIRNHFISACALYTPRVLHFSAIHFNRVNFCLQCLGVMRRKINDKEEHVIAPCKNVSQLHSAAERHADLSLSVLDSIPPVKALLSEQGKPLKYSVLHQDNHLKRIWSSMRDADPALECGKVYRSHHRKILVH